MECQIEEANGQDITRYLCLCPTFGVVVPELKKQLADRLVQVAAEPQDCSNAVLALARQGVDAETTAVQLIEKMVTLKEKLQP